MLNSFKQKRERYFDIAFFFLLILATILLLYRLPYGMADIDESFYLSIPYRLCQGDALIVDEWHVSQLSGFLQYPVMWFYLLFAKTTEGIILTFRYFYVIFQLIVAIGIYCIVRRYQIVAIGAALIYFLFSPFNIMALSYNSMGLAFALLFSLLLWMPQRTTKFTFFLAGICFACLVLCNPYCIIIFFLYLLTSFIFHLIYRNKAAQKIPVSFQWKSVLGVFCGSLAIMIIFLIFIFSRSTLSELLVSLPHILNDPSHPRRSIRSLLKPIIYFILDYKFYIIPAVLLPFISFLDRNKRRRKFYFCLTIIVSLFMTFYFAKFQTTGLGMNAVMLPFSSIGLTAFFCTPKEHKNMALFYGYVVGILYAACMILSSNQDMYVVSDALVVSDIFSLLMISHYVKNNHFVKVQWFQPALIIFLIVFQLGAQSYVKMNHVFWEQPISELTSIVPSGPAKGLRTTNSRVDTYMQVIDELHTYLSDVEGQRVHFFRTLPYGYLYTGSTLGTYSAWGNENLTLDEERLEIYFSLHPDKVPQKIYVVSNVVQEYENDIWEDYALTHGYVLEQLPSGSLLYNKS